MLKDTASPLYYRLKEILREKIDDGEWKPHSAIPSIRALCAMYGISTTTAKQAIQELTHEGKVYAMQGKGTFVAAPQFAAGRVEYTEISADVMLNARMKAIGIKYSCVLLGVERQPANRVVADALAIPIGAPSLKITRFKKANDEPMLIEQVYVDAGKYGKIETADLTRPMYEIIKLAYSIELKKSVEKFTPVFLESADAQILDQKPGALALSNERTSLSQGGEAIIYARSLIRGDKCKMYVDLTQLRTLNK
ncbi:HTH-type transcriptional repressor YvoA [bioreactor metagenome]|jgi:GntR family transcriptional regulator|uniref:HTH-type transcriptional repressor YvoA n=1 Tax=bioreactor metagenome TaxID=1076179 RepID=A0A644SWB3_9ZZZZ|nr:GntR family transcriptional regulator [Spirochaetales bacterium]NLX46520.1 GntR family transcriptional regulator [Treponema sp.]